MAFLLDTNILSDLRRGERGNVGLADWNRTQSRLAMFTSVIVIGELRRGVKLLQRHDRAQAARVASWLMTIVTDFEGRVLPVDMAVMDIWSGMGIPDPLPMADALIAATAIRHDLTVVTRNAADFSRTGAKFLNPCI